MVLVVGIESSDSLAALIKSTELLESSQGTLFRSHSLLLNGYQHRVPLQPRQSYSCVLAKLIQAYMSIPSQHGDFLENDERKVEYESVVYPSNDVTGDCFPLRTSANIHTYIIFFQVSSNPQQAKNNITPTSTLRLTVQVIVSHALQVSTKAVTNESVYVEVSNASGKGKHPLKKNDETQNSGLDCNIYSKCLHYDCSLSCLCRQ